MSNIRNFVIISHIDHGKSTLADRFLEITNTVSKDKMNPQYLDSMNLEKEKGITIKMHPVTMQYNGYQLNLIDTPGHVDFSYETSRALACVEGAILLVDAVKGLQAQTIFNLEQWGKENVIGVVNKIDLPFAMVEENRKELASLLKKAEDEIFLISAKTGENVKELLGAVIKQIPCPSISASNDFQGLVFDSKYDLFSGVIAYIRVFQGEVKKGDKIYFLGQNVSSEAKEVGIFSPGLTPTKSIKAGEIGYIKTGIKEAVKVRVGDTITKENLKDKIKPLPGYKTPQSVLFVSLYPEKAEDFSSLKNALEKLRLNDPALSFKTESKAVLGRGIRVGFLGSLQAEIAIRRLKEEFGLKIISSVPQVVFKIITKNDKEIEIISPDDWPETSNIKATLEPWVKVEIVSPNKYLSQIFKLLEKDKFVSKEINNLGSEKSVLIIEAPLRKIITGSFYDDLKSQTNGYASFSYFPIGFRESNLVKLDILILGKKASEFSKIVPKDKAFSEGKAFLKKLKEILPAQQFALPLQTCIGSQIIARETIRAQRKDVTAPLYGGDVTRKMKLLKIQKRGKKKLKERAKIKIPPSIYLKMLKF